MSSTNGNILVTGAGSGLGCFLAQSFPECSIITRATTKAEMAQYRSRTWRAIVHCAFNSKRPLMNTDLYCYYHDNIELTQELLSFNCAKFIYMSSVDVYPVEKYSREDEVIPADKARNVYALTKLLNESVILGSKDKCLILRPTALLGAHARHGNLIRMLEDDVCKLTLSADSVFNYILYADVLEFVNAAIERDLTGIYNLAAFDNIVLADAATMLGRKVEFGSYRHQINRMDNSKAAGVCGVFKNSSRDNIARFVEEYKRIRAAADRKV